MLASPSTRVGAPRAGWAVAFSLGLHGALLLVSLAAHGAAVPPPVVVEHFIDVDITAVPPAPERLPLADPEPPIPRATPHPAPPQAPAPQEVAHRATKAAEAPSPPEAQEAAPALTTDEGMPHFTIAIGGGSAPAYGAVSGAGTARAEVVDAPLPEKGVSSRAHLARGGAPPYPSAARAAGIEGDVLLELVLSAVGTVESARVVKGAGHGLDEAAVAAVRAYHFSPATKDGRPVRVRMPWTMQFRLQ